MVSTTIPSSWFREPGFYELERRAVFSKTWLIVSHKSQFHNPGDYARYDVAGYSFFVICDRDGIINGFLNTCRQGSGTIIDTECGKASALCCKCHGWSYSFEGSLVEPSQAKMSENKELYKGDQSLYKLHLYIDKLGFVWVNLDAARNPSISWEAQFKDVDVQERLSDNFDMDNYQFDHTWSLDECNFNWKTLVENYNECYHCSTAHPGIAPFIKRDTKFDVATKLCYILHLGQDIAAEDIYACPTYMFPSASVTLSPHFFYMMFIIPTSPITSRMRYEVYRNKNSTEEEFKAEIDFFKQVENEDKWLGNNAQKGLSSDTYMAGPLHPYMERAVKYFEDTLRPMLKEHIAVEMELGRQIWPAQRTPERQLLQEGEASCKQVYPMGMEPNREAAEPVY